MDNKNSPLNLLEEMRQYLSAADDLRRRMEQKLRSLCADEVPGPRPMDGNGHDDTGEK